MAFLKEEKAQASIELLILVGGAIVLASIVGLLLKNAATQAAIEANQKAMP